MKKAIFIFAKNLIYGEVKTRLAATVGNDEALSVYKNLLRHTEAITNYLPVEKTVFYSNFIERQDIWNNEVYKKQLQCGNDLGERMQNAFTSAFQEGSREVIIIGTDCFELSSAIIMNAFVWLKNNDVVIGPATDGGYYLLGMKKLHSFLFQDMKWSTDSVLNDTIEMCNEHKLSYFLLPDLIDIDEEKDLINFKNYLI